MAKDGTSRGGPRPGQGRPRKALAEKIMEGKAEGEMVLPEPAELEGTVVPDVKEYMTRRQKDGTMLCAPQVYRDTMVWLNSLHCERLVNAQLVEQYAMSVARWIACEEAISEFGYLAKHPTTQAPSTSPFVTMGQNYLRQSTQIWFQIYSIVKENSTVMFNGSNPHDSLMERLLTARKG